MNKDKPSVCKRSESRESFIREDAPRKHKMRPPTAPTFQPYEVAEDYGIEYNQNYEYDPNVEVLTQYFHFLNLSLVLSNAGLLLRSILRASSACLRGDPNYV